MDSSLIPELRNRNRALIKHVGIMDGANHADPHSSRSHRLLLLPQVEVLSELH